MNVAVEFGFFLTGQLWNFGRLILFDNNSRMLACLVFGSGLRTYKVYIKWALLNQLLFRNRIVLLDFEVWVSGQILKLVYLTDCSSLIFESWLTNLLSTVNCPVSSSSLYHRKASFISVFSSPTPADEVINLLFLKSDWISDQTPVVPGVQHSFSGVVGHHGVVVVLIGELNVGILLLFSRGVVCKVDGRCPV